MAVETSLVFRSRRRVIILYALFLCLLLYPCSLFYYGIVRDIIDYPEMRTLKFYKMQIEYQPKTFTTMVILCYLMVCCLVCALFILLSACVAICWPCLKRYRLFTIRRRTVCFCRYARRRLVNILMSIHDSQCTWQSQQFQNLDDRTQQCIVLVSNAIKTKLQCEDLDVTLVGSSAEGLGKPYTLELKNGYRDPLCRFLLRFFCCCFPCNTSYSSLRTDIDVVIHYTDGEITNSRGNNCSTLFQIREYDEKPGFVKVILNSKVRTQLTTPWQSFCTEDNDQKVLSSAEIRRAILHSVNSINEHNLPASSIFGYLKHPPYIELDIKGPATKLTVYPVGQMWYWNENQKFVTFEGDFVFGIHCLQQWPICAMKWLSRPRYWPSPGDVETIANNGFVLVAKSSISSSPPDEDDVEWMVSFPHSETYLSSCIPQTAKACYLALKIIFKDHLSYYSENLKTYQLKTLLFWELEKHPAEFWDKRNIEQCFMCLLEKLIHSVSNKTCPSYWIENHNLFQNCDGKDLVEVSCILQNIKSNPAPYVEDFGSMWC